MPSFRKRQLSPNSIFDKQALKQFFKENDIKEIHINTIHRLMLKNPNLKFSEIPNLPKKQHNYCNQILCRLHQHLKHNRHPLTKKPPNY